MIKEEIYEKRQRGINRRGATERDIGWTNIG
jgi:hypothetical protein